MRDFLDIINASAFSPNCKQTKMLLLKVYDYISLLTTDDSLHHWLMSFAGHRTPKKVKENWLTLTKQNMDMTFRILNDSGWSVEKKNGSDMIWSKYIPNFGKVLKFEGIIDNSVQTIKGKIIDDIENSPEWNSNLQEVRIVKQIDERTTITQSISKRYHAISSRDFVHLRSWTQIDNSIMLTCVSISHPDIPESSNAIRAEHKLFAYILHPVQNEPFKTHFICLMNVNLRGWLPQRIVDQTISMGMEDHIRDIRSSVKN